MALVAAPLLAVGAFLAVVVPHEHGMWRDSWQVRLEALADDRQRAIGHALADAHADAAVVARYPTVVALASGRRQGSGPPGESPVQRLRGLLEHNEQAHGYVGYWALDRDGRVLASSSDRPLEQSCLDAVRQAIGHKEGSTSLHRHRNGRVVVAITEPIPSPAGKPIGTVLLAAPADRLLFDALRAGTALGRTGESLLAAPIDGDALFISPLLGVPGGPLGLRVPLERVPFAKAGIEGREGFGIGPDYRQETVLAATRRIASTGWGLVVKIDRAEAAAQLHNSVATAGLGLALALLAVMGAGGMALARARRALGVVATRFGVLFEHAGDGIYLVDAEGRIVEANGAAARIIGVPRERLIGMDTAPLHGGDPGAGAPFETTWERATDDRVELEIVLCPVPGEELTIAVARDVTSRRAAEEALRARERHFRAIAESLPQIVFTCDAHGETDYISDQWTRFTGLPRGSVRASAWLKAVHPDDRQALSEAWRQAVAGGEPFERVYRLRTGDDDHRWVLGRAVPLLDGDGRVMRWFGTLTDVDDVKRLQEQLAQARDSLEARVHERTAELERAQRRLKALNRRMIQVQEEERQAVARELHDEAAQSLTALLLALNVLERGSQGDPERAAQFRELKAMVDQVMRELHALAVRLRPASLDRMGLEPAVRQLVHSLAGHLVNADFEAIGLDRGRLDEEVEASAYRLVQESVTNAVRHARASRLTVMLSQHEGELVGVVEDDGVGFDPQTAERGGRLGLTGMRERIDLLGGRLDIESGSGGGTTVRFAIPARAHPSPVESRAGATS